MKQLPITRQLLLLTGALALALACGAAPRETVKTDSQAGRVVFKVTPPTATVIIDGVERGKARDFDGTPAVLELPPGKHLIELHHPQHVPVRKKIYLSDTQETIRVKMKRRARR